MNIEMQHQAMGYDRTATMFSPDGHLLQVEYAEKTVRLGVSSIGMECTDGIFIIADKRINDPLVVKESASRIHEIDNNIISSIAGITSDGRILIEKAQLLAQQQKITFESDTEPELVIKEISNLKQQFTQYGGARPFGVSIMLGGVYNDKSYLYVSDVTGNYFSYHANAIGENDEKIKVKLREKIKKQMNIKDGIKLAIEIYKEILAEKFNLENFEIGIIEISDKKLKRIEGEKIKELIR